MTFYITEETKKELEGKIVKLENDPIFIQWKHNVDTHNGHSPQQSKAKAVLEAKIEVLEDILGNTIILSVEEKLEKSWY